MVGGKHFVLGRKGGPSYVEMCSCTGSYKEDWCLLFQQHIVEGQHADVSKCWLVVWLKVQARQAEARRRAEEEAFEIQLPDASPATVAVQTDMRLVVAWFVSVTRNDSYESQFLSFPFLDVIVETNWIHGWLTWVGAYLWRSFFCRQGLRSSVEWRRKAAGDFIQK